MTDMRKVAAVVRNVIRAEYPEWWEGGEATDIVGHKVYYHPATDTHPATMVWESEAWADYVITDKIQEGLEDAGLDVAVEVMSSYEVSLEVMS